MSTPERLAYWYLRLNGFLTIENFVVHPDAGSNQRTDADLLAVRFKHRAELLENSMQDDPLVAECNAYANVIIAEVKTRQCALNGPWTREEDQNIQRVLKAIGCLDEDEISVASEALYRSGEFVKNRASIRLMAFGDRENSELRSAATQILFDQMIRFIYERLAAYEQQKRSVGNWAPDGEFLRKAFDGNRSNQLAFREEVRRGFGLKENDEFHGPANGEER